MPPSQDVTLDAATAGDAPVVANLLELYVHDLSGIFPQEIGADGRFGYVHLPLYWSEPSTRFAFLIRAGGRLAGFVLATRGSPASDDPDHLDVAEFFVLRSYRRSGVGRAAAFALWDRLPGEWIVRVSEAHPAGLSFWKPVIEDYTHGAFSTRIHHGRQHTFQVFQFRSRNSDVAA